MTDNTNEYYTRVFDVRVASIKEIGDVGAILLQQIRYWLDITQKQAETDKEIRDDHFINGKWWIYNTFEDWHEQFPNWDVSTIKRAFSRLKKSGVVLTGCFNKKGYDRTTWYTVDEKCLETLINTHSGKMPQWKVSNCPNGKGQNDTMDSGKLNRPIPKNTTNTSSNNSTDNTDKGISAEPKPTPPLNDTFLVNAVNTSCSSLGITDKNLYINIVRVFVKAFKEYRQEEHPHISFKSMQSGIEALHDFETDNDNLIDLDDWQAMIDKYFSTPFDNCDYHFNHFASPNILQNRFFESVY